MNWNRLPVSGPGTGKLADESFPLSELQSYVDLEPTIALRTPWHVHDAMSVALIERRLQR